MTAELFLIDAHSKLGMLVETEPLLEGIRATTMHSVEKTDFAVHDI